MDFIKNWFHHLFPSRSWQIVGEVSSADKIPRHIPRNGAIVVGTGPNYKWLSFDCPCRSGHRIMVNLDGARLPAWNMSSMKPLTVMPSFDVQEPGRHCHFFMRNGNVEWV